MSVADSSLGKTVKPTFKAIESEIEFVQEMERFQIELSPPIPVWINHRIDLSEAVDLANTLYQGLVAPNPATFGVLLSELGNVGSYLISSLAVQWITLEELLNLTQESVQAPVLIVGIYDDLDWHSIRRLILHSYNSPGFSLGFLTGRDLHSLLWLAAKQWALIRSDIQEIGFFSAVDSPQPQYPVRVYSDADFEREDIQSIILNQAWRQVLFQGHGKDDNINLGDFTICGRNDFIAAKPETLYPRCGYGWSCFKDEAKLISLRRLRAAEVILSACNSGPLPGLGLYDSKYLLLLNAIDGCAQVITAALSVQDSDAPENHLWIKYVAEGGIRSTSLVNQSLHFQHPYPAFWHFGIPSRTEVNNLEELNLNDKDLYGCISRLHSYLVSNLLPPNYPLLSRLQKFNQKVNLYLSRRQRYEDRQEAGKLTQSLRSDLQSLDYSLAQRIISCPEDDIMHFGSYYSDRSTLASATVKDVPCSCGYPAQQFQRQGLLHTILTTTHVFCLRCGDKVFRLDGAPIIECSTVERIQVGQSLAIKASVYFQETGPVQIGVFVPSYLRNDVTIEPDIKRLKGRTGEAREIEFSLNFGVDVPAQAYYFTIFAVQNLGLSTYRQHFGIEKKF